MRHAGLVGSFFLLACSAAGEGGEDLSGVTKDLAAARAPAVEPTRVMKAPVWATCWSAPTGDRFAFRCARAAAEATPYPLERLAIRVRTAREALETAFAVREGQADVRSDLRAEDYPLTVRTAGDVLAPSSVVVPNELGTTATVAAPDATLTVQQPFDVWPIQIDVPRGVRIEVDVPGYTFGPPPASFVATVPSLIQRNGSATLLVPVPASGKLEARVRTSAGDDARWTDVRAATFGGPGRYVAEGEIIRRAL